MDAMKMKVGSAINLPSKATFHPNRLMRTQNMSNENYNEELHLKRNNNDCKDPKKVGGMLWAGPDSRDTDDFGRKSHCNQRNFGSFVDKQTTTQKHARR
jgi:hypothetical protein